MKKFLSMVLALAMAMSLVTFAAPAAGAKDFTDNSSIQYKEAVDVISAIQIMDGYADSSFNPSGTLTRGAAAKIICNMILGPTTASALPTSGAPFPDVPAGSTFAGYIAYCADHDIISGYADGNFRPADSLSGYAFLKMLLCALGYDQKIEGYQGANWRVNVAKQALGIGLDDGLNGELDGTRIVTREEAALYAFNTLQSDLVEYDTKTTVTVSDATVTVGGNNFHSKVAPSQNSAYNNIDSGFTTGSGIAGNRNIVQFAEEYFNRLERFPKKNNDFEGEGDSFGRPSTKWVWKGVEIGTYKVAPAKTYYGNVTVSAIYNDLSLPGTAEDAYVFLNGNEVFRIDVKRSNGDKLFHKDDQKDAFHYVGGNKVFYTNADAGFAAACDKVGDGTIIEVFRNDADNKVVICAASVYPGEIDSTHARSSTKDAYVVITEKKANATEDGTSFTKSGHDEFETDENFQEEEIVWFTYSAKDHEIGEVHRMESVEGTLNRRVNEKSVTLSNVVYKFGEEYAMDIAESSLDNSSNYIIYRDSQGYLLWLEEADFAVTRYAVIQRISVEGSGTNVLYRFIDANGNPSWPGLGASTTSWDGSRVRLLLSSGVERNYDLDESKRYRAASTDSDAIAGSFNSDGTLSNDSIKNVYDAGQVVRFTENSNGTVRLYTAGAMPGTTGTIRTANTINNAANGLGAFTINNHVMNNLYRENADGSVTRVRADSDTIFVIKDPDGTKTYTGLRNAPDVRATTTTTVAAYAYINTNATTPTARLVYVVVGSANDVESSSKDITFLTKPSDKYESDTGEAYYEYKAIIKGEIQTLPVYVYESTALVGAKEDITEDTGTWNDGDAPSVITGNDYRTGSIILNKTTYDNDDFLTRGSFSSKSIQSMVAQGIKRTNVSDEIKLDTHDADHTETVASGVNVFYISGDTITRIGVSEIHNDNDDMVYYTVDDDGDITNLFIVDYEDDDSYIAFAGIDSNGDVYYYWNNDADEDEDGVIDAQAAFDAKSADSQANDLLKALMWNTSIQSISYAGGTFSGVMVNGAPINTTTWNAVANPNL